MPTSSWVCPTLRNPIVINAHICKASIEIKPSRCQENTTWQSQSKPTAPSRRGIEFPTRDLRRLGGGGAAPRNRATRSLILMFCEMVFYICKPWSPSGFCSGWSYCRVGHVARSVVFCREPIAVLCMRLQSARCTPAYSCSQLAHLKASDTHRADISIV